MTLLAALVLVVFLGLPLFIIWRNHRARAKYRRPSWHQTRNHPRPK